MPQSYSYWRRVDFVSSDTLIRSAIARWLLAGVEWLRAIFAIFLAPVPAGRCRELPGSSHAVVPPRRPSYVLLFTSHCTSVQLLKPTPALRPVFLVPTRARIATHSCAHATAYPANSELSSRSFCSLSAARQGVSGPRVVQPFIFTRYPLPGRRVRTASGPGVHLHSLSAAKKAYPDPEWSSRSSLLAIRRRKAYPDRGWSRRSSSLAVRLQEGVSGPRRVQAFIVTRYPPPLGRRIRTATGPGVYLHSLSATRRAYPDPEWSRRTSLLAIRLQEGVSGPRVVQAFIFTRYPPPGRRIGTPSGPGVHLHSLSAARKAYPDPEWSRRSSALAIRFQKGVSGPRVVQPFIFTRCPLPGRRIRTLDGPAVHLHSLSASRKAYRTPSGPAVHLHSLSAARKAYPDCGWSSCSSPLAIRCQEGVSGSRVVQAFIFTRCPPPGRRIGTPSGPSVHLQSLSAARKAYPDPEWSRRSSSLAVRLQEGLPDPEWSSRSSSLAIRCQEGVSGPRVVQLFISTRYPPPGRRIRTPSGPAVHRLFKADQTEQTAANETSRNGQERIQKRPNR